MNGMQIKELDINLYKGKEFSVEYETSGYYDLIKEDFSFTFVFKKLDKIEKRGFKDKMCAEWLTDPHLFGAFINEKLVGFIETSKEEWNSRLRVSNILIDKEYRHLGIGTKLMERVKIFAKENKFRQIVLETQSCNVNAINFYLKKGFSLIGLDAYSYSNEDIEKHEIRMELGYIIR